MQETNIKTVKTKQRVNKSIVYTTVIIVSLFLSYLLIPTFGYTEFPYLAIGLSFIIIDILAFVIRPKKDPYSIALFFFALSAAFFIFYRANPFLTFLNIITSIYLTSFLAIYTKPSEISLGKLIFAPLIALYGTLTTKNLYTLGKKPEITKGLEKFNPTDKVRVEISVGIITTIVLLAFVIPMLSYVNPIFGDIFKNATEYLGEILPNIFRMATVLRVVLFLILIFLIPRTLSYITIGETNKYQLGNAEINLWIPKLAMVIILSLFFVTQAQLYFSGPETLEALGYSNSEYAREVFAQLTVVAIIIFGLIYLDPKNNKGFSKILTYILAAQGLFLTFMGFKSVLDYVENWGFTHKRLYGITGVIWAVSAFILVIIKNIQKKSTSIFLSELLMLSIATVFFINLFNFDYIIYHYGKKTTTHEGVDYRYLSRLSPDSDSYNDHLKKITNLLEDELSDIPYFIETKEVKYEGGQTSNMIIYRASEDISHDSLIDTRNKLVHPGREIERNLLRIKLKYIGEDHFDFRTFNFSDYQSYKTYDQEIVDEFNKSASVVEGLERDYWSIIAP